MNKNSFTTIEDTKNAHRLVTGTSYKGMLKKTKFGKLVDTFGKYHGPSLDSKIDARWVIVFGDNKVATIYNFKDGKAYCGKDGKDLKDITEWHIGGLSSEVVKRVNDWIE